MRLAPMQKNKQSPDRLGQILTLRSMCIEHGKQTRTLEVFSGQRPSEQIVYVLAQITHDPFSHRCLKPMFVALGNMLKARANKLAQ